MAQFFDYMFAPIDPKRTLATRDHGRCTREDRNSDRQRPAATWLDKLVVLIELVLGGDPSASSGY